MATITVDPEHIQGLRYLHERELSRACETEDVEQLQELLALHDELAKRAFPREISLPDDLLERLTAGAWNTGNDILSDFYGSRVNRPKEQWRDAEDEQAARSMLASHEHMQGQEVVV